MNLYRSHSLSFRRILNGTRHANRRLGRALSGPIPSGPTPCIPVYQNGSTVVTVTTAHRRQFSASGWQNKKKGPSVSPNPQQLRRPFKWATPTVSHDVYDVLESHILDSSRLAAERFPVVPATPDFDTQTGLPLTLDPHDPEHETPPPPPDPDDDDPLPRKTYDALVIDCEMVSMKGREQGLLNIAVIDFFTGYIVLRTLVRPTATVTDWRREFTGFNKQKFAQAVRKGKALSGGWREVREKIFDVTTSKTIFIGHALANDLRVLRIATDRVVDSMVMISRAVFGDAKTFPRNWSLKTACRELLDADVQKTSKPHSPLEDAFATRELVLQFVQNPEKLAEWAARIRANLARIVEKEKAKEEARLERKKLRLERKKLRKAEEKNKTPEQLVEDAAKRAKAQEEKAKLKAKLKEEKARGKEERRKAKKERQKMKVERRKAEAERRALERANRKKKSEESRALEKIRQQKIREEAEGLG